MRCVSIRVCENVLANAVKSRNVDRKNKEHAVARRVANSDFAAFIIIIIIIKKQRPSKKC